MPHPLAGKPAPVDRLVDVVELRREYFERRIDPPDPKQRVRFGASGHRGSSLNGAFNEAHVLAMTRASAARNICGGFRKKRRRFLERR
jgi:phosphoglucomutase